MPYSDNLYSIDSDDEYPDVSPIAGHGAYQGPSQPQEQPPLDPASLDTGPQEDDEDPDHMLSPADGNFPSTHTNVSGTRTSGTSSYVPHVPNVLVRDPSLEQGSTAASKAQEARQEREAAAAAAAATADGDIDHDVELPAVHNSSTASNAVSPPLGATSPTSSSAYQPAWSTTSSRATHYQPSTAGAYSSYTPSTTSRQTTSHGPRRSIYNPTAPLLPREAPPAYTPSPTVTSGYTGSTSPTSPTASSHAPSDFSRSYRTFSQSSMGRPEETRGLLAEPESMGGPPDDDLGDATRTWRDRVTRRAPYLNWRNCRYATVSLVLLLLAVGILIDGIMSVEKDLQPKEPPSSDPSKSPVLEPPHIDYPPYDGDLPWIESGECSAQPVDKVSISFPVKYGPGNSLSVVQNITEPDDNWDTHDVRVWGDIIVRRTGQGSPRPSVSLELLTNDNDIHITAQWDKEQQSLYVGVPRRLRSMDPVAWPCVAIRVTLWVPGDAVLDSLVIDNVHLGIRLMDNLALQVADYAHLKTVVGPIVAATDGTSKADNLVEDSAPDYFKFDSRVIEVSSTSADITGYWPLYDYLGLYNIAGKIKVRVSPKEELKHSPKPATLYVKSLSGKIEVWEPVDKAVSSLSLSSLAATSAISTNALGAEQHIPPRDYRVNIQSTSGTISGAVAFSSACRIHSTSGNTLIELVPVVRVEDADNDAAANLETSITSGTTKLQILEPLWISEDGKGYLSPELPESPDPSASPAPPPPVPKDGPRSPDDERDVIPIGKIGNGDPYNSLPPAAGSRSPLLPVAPSPDLDTTHQEETAATSSSSAQSSPKKQAPRLRPFRCLKSRHASTSAELRIAYPASWEGEFDLGSISGYLRIQGEGVKVIRDGKDWPGINRHLVARKGPVEGGGSTATVKTTSGGVRVQVGE